MFNFFKLPLGMKSRASNPDDLFTEFETGLMTNFFRQKRNFSDDDIYNAQQVASKEMKALRNQLDSANSNDFYEKMTASLRRIESDLDDY